jgi:hypothetical protein
MSPVVADVVKTYRAEMAVAANPPDALFSNQPTTPVITTPGLRAETYR